MLGFFKKKKLFKKSQEHHRARSEQLEKINSSCGIPEPDNWVNQVYHIRVYKQQEKQKRVLDKAEKKVIYDAAVKEVLDFVDKNMFKL